MSSVPVYPSWYSTVTNPVERERESVCVDIFKELGAGHSEISGQAPMLEILGGSGVEAQV